MVIGKYSIVDFKTQEILLERVVAGLKVFPIPQIH